MSSNLNSILSNARDTDYPEQVWWFIAVFIALLALLHLWNLAMHFRRRLTLPSQSETQADPEDISRGNGSGSESSIKRLSIVAQETLSILLYRCTTPLGYSDHRVNWAEIGVVSTYIAVVLAWTFVNCYDSDTGLRIDPQYFADRAGNIVASHIPLLVLLSGKNNLLSLITGISFEKLHILHRAIARFSIVLILVHACGRISLGLTGSDAITEPWLRTGIAAFAAWVILVVIFIRPLRTKYYNVFVVVHIVLALMIIIGLFYHIRGAAGSYQDYMVPAFAFWGFDRAVRLARVFWNNRGIFPTPVEAEVMSSNMIKLRTRQWMSWKAGQSAYITIPQISWMPFEAHPFTIATIPLTEEGIPSELVFLVKVKNGFTKRLYHAISDAQRRHEELRISAFIDGPYGSPPNLNSFSDIIIITGGSGISFGLPLLQEIARNVEKCRSSCRSVILVWAVATSELNTGAYGWILESLTYLMQHTPPALRIRVCFHATRQTSSFSSLNKLSTNEKEEIKQPAVHDTEKSPSPLGSEDLITFNSGRPDIQSLLEDELSSVGTTVSVNVAGPLSMVEDVRRALRFKLITPRAILKGQPRVSLHTEPYEIA